VFHVYLPKWSKTESLHKEFYSPEKSTTESLMLWTSFLYPFQIFKKARSDNVNVVHIQWELNVFGSFYSSLLLPLLLLFLRILKIKSVVTVHSVIPRSYFGLELPGFTIPFGMTIFVESLFVFLYKIIALLSNAIIVHGEFLKKRLCVDYKLKPEKVFAMPYGVSSATFPLPSSRKYGAHFLENSEIILAIGTVSPRKGLDVLIKAFEMLSPEHPSWTLVISGRVPTYYESYYLRLKKLSSNLAKQNRVIFLGEFNLSDVNRLLEISKVVVFPYLYNFGASSTLTFALQHRKIVVISALNFSTDILTDGENALLVPPRNPTLLAKAIERAMCDDKLRRDIRKGINILLQRSSWDFVANETLSIYNKVLFGSI